MAARASLVLVLCVAGLFRPARGLNADYFGAPEILEDSRHPLSYTTRSGNIATVGHFRGVLQQGTRSVCNTITCYKMPQYKYVSRGWADIFVSVYNASRVLQWTRTAGGNGDDRARAVNTNLDGNIMVAGYTTGLNAKFSGLTLSSRSALSRTIFLASYSPSGAILYVLEAASCAVGKCDVTAISSDETGTVLTGKFRQRISFGVKRSCTPTAPVQCMAVEEGSLNMLSNPSLEFEGKQKSTGSGVIFNEYCWVAKYNPKGHYLWHKFCDDPSLESDVYKSMLDRLHTTEQTTWAAHASKFFTLDPQDATGLLGKDSSYAAYAARRVPYGI